MQPDRADPTWMFRVGAELALTEQPVSEELTARIRDEADSTRGEVSGVSPIARTLLKARVGDVLHLVTPAGVEDIEVLRVEYPAPTAGA